MRESAMNAVGAVSLVFHAQRYRYLAMGLFAFGLTFYAFTLPATYTGGVIGLISLRYLNAELFFFSVALAALLHEEAENGQPRLLRQRRQPRDCVSYFHISSNIEI